MFLRRFKVGSLGLTARRVAICHVESTPNRFPIWRPPLFSTSSRLLQENSEPKDTSQDRRKLFVKNLKFKTKEDDVREYFSSFGEIEEVEFPVTNMTRRSKGFAFVTFREESDAEKALNYPHTFKERDLIVEYASSDPPPARCRTNVICVKNITHDITREQVIDHFSAFGKVISVDFPVDFVTLRRRFFCFVHFTYNEEADEAVKTRFQTLNSCSVEVRKSLARMSPTFTDRIVLYPPQDSTVESIKKYFEKFGNVKSIVLKFVFGDGESSPRLVGLVLFDNNNSALQVLDKSHIIDGQEVVVFRGDPNSKFQTTADLRLLVDYLPPWMTEKDVKDYFKEFGFVNLCHFLTDPKTGGKLAWCLVSFNSVSGVNKVMAKPRHMIGGKWVRVRRKGWQSEELRSEMNTNTDLFYS